MPRLYRKVIHIRAEDSPNVRLARAEQQMGLEPSGRIVLPGVLPWDDFVKRTATWDKIRQTIGLLGLFYEGAELLMFPPDWIDRAERIAAELSPKVPRRARAIGCDPGEGGAKSSWAVVDDRGVLELDSRLTPDTTEIPRITLDKMRRWNVEPQHVLFDRGGGGKQHADYLRKLGYAVRTVAFGETISAEPRRMVAPLKERKDLKEDRYAYVNRRAQMYDDLRWVIDPARAADGGEYSTGFAIPEGLRGKADDPTTELRHQLALIPLLYDPEGRLKMLPKNKRSPDSEERTLTELIGHSPDEADAVVLAVHGMLRPERRPILTVS